MPALIRVKRRVAPTTSAASRGSSAPPPREIVVVIFHVWNPPQKLADVASTARQGAMRAPGVRGGGGSRPGRAGRHRPRTSCAPDARRLATLATADGLRLFVLPVFHILGGDFEIVEFLLEAGQEGVARLGVVSFEVEGEVFAPPRPRRSSNASRAADTVGGYPPTRLVVLGRLDGGDALGARPDVLMREAAAVGEAVRAKSRGEAARERETSVEIDERLLASRAATA